MREPVALQLDYDAVHLRRIARESEDADQVQRLLALAVIYEGGSRTQAAEVGGVTLQVVRDWVLRFNADGPPRSDRPQGSRPAVTAKRITASRARSDGGDRCDPGGAWRGPLADHRSLSVGLG